LFRSSTSEFVFNDLSMAFDLGVPVLDPLLEFGTSDLALRKKMCTRRCTQFSKRLRHLMPFLNITQAKFSHRLSMHLMYKSRNQGIPIFSRFALEIIRWWSACTKL